MRRAARAKAIGSACLLVGLSACTLVFSDGAGSGDECPEGIEPFPHELGRFCLWETRSPSIGGAVSSCAGRAHRGVPGHLAVFTVPGEIEAIHAFDETLQEGDLSVGLFQNEEGNWVFATGEESQLDIPIANPNYPNARCAAFSDPKRLIQWPCNAAAFEVENKTQEQAICQWDGVPPSTDVLPQ